MNLGDTRDIYVERDLLFAMNFAVEGLVGFLP